MNGIEPKLEHRLKWHPSWVWDPVPDFFKDRLEPVLVQELIKVQLSLEMDFLRARLKAAERQMEIITKAQVK